MSGSVREWINAQARGEDCVASLEPEQPARLPDIRDQQIADLRAALQLIRMAAEHMVAADPLRAHIVEIARKALEGK